MTVFVHFIVITCFKFLFVKRLGPTAGMVDQDSLWSNRPNLERIIFDIRHNLYSNTQTII